MQHHLPTAATTVAALDTPSMAITISANPIASSNTSYVASSSTQPINLTSLIDDNIIYHEDNLDQLAETWLKVENNYYTALKGENLAP
jgi:hypothetical protein